MLKLRYVPLSLRKLDIVTINELLGIFFSDVIVGTKKLYRSDEVAVRANDVRPILCHRIPLLPEVPPMEHGSTVSVCALVNTGENRPPVAVSFECVGAALVLFSILGLA